MPNNLSEQLHRAIAQIAPNAKIRATCTSDLDQNGYFGKQHILLADDALIIFTPNGSEPQISFKQPLNSISEVETERIVGGGILRATINGRKVDLLAYTNARTNQFDEVCKQFNAIIQKKEYRVESEKKSCCSKCGQSLEIGTSICPRCLNKSATLLRLLKYTIPYKKHLILLILILLSISAISLIPPYFTKILVDDVLLPKKNIHLLFWLVVGLGICRVAVVFFNILRARVAAWVSSHIVFNMRSELYERTQWLTLRYFDRHPTGTIISRLTQDTAGVQDFLSLELPWVASNSLTIIGVMILFVAINWKLALLTLIPTPLVAVLSRLSRQRLQRTYRLYWHAWSRFHDLVSDVFNRIKIIKIFSQQSSEIIKFNFRNLDQRYAGMRSDQDCTTFTSLVNSLLIMSPLLVWYFGGRMIVEGSSLTIGGLMAFLFYVTLLYTPMEKLLDTVQTSSKALTAAERVFEVLDAKTESEKDRGYFVSERVIQGAIEFRNVTFGYDKHQPVLKDISFKVEPGQMLGLVGRNGEGKTTIINLICRFYDPDEGKILVDGIDLREWNIENYRSQFGAVLQEPFLFSGTIAENIAYGKPTASIEEIISAARMANAHSFIINKPDTYDEQVGANGSRLSGGEKQRICIARAILQNPAILILDEATANVDLETEDQIQQAIAHLIGGRTTFAIAHRLATLRNAHNLLVLENHKIAEFGSHENLQRKQGIYSHLLEIYQKTSQVTAIDG